MFKSLWKVLAEEAGGAYANYTKTKQQKAELADKQHERQMNKLSDDSDKASDADAFYLQNAGGKRDISFAILLLPVPLAFYPPAIPHIMAGFEALEAMPMWYKLSLGAMFVSVWGLRRLAIAYFQARMIHKAGK